MKLIRFFLSMSMAFVAFASFADEGMYPLSEINRINFKKAGFKLTQKQMYSPGQNSQIDALVRIGGCTGSFVSKQGLIITNHHCVFSSVAAVSTPAKDYLTNGFYAGSRDIEIPVKDLTVKITVSYEDVSAKVLANAKGQTDPNKRIDAIRSAINSIQKEENAKDSTLSCEISEMFSGKTYVLFRYQIIRDIRLVYVPPRNIGEFGGESDNWVWPRHTGDFSIVRAYVGKDGSGKAYSKDNVPFVPKRILKINPKGVNEGDMVFILGYPGTTFKNYPASYLEFQNQQLLPYTVKIHDWLIAYMNKLAATDKGLMLKYAGKTKSLANVTKNYKGKIQGLQRTTILQDKHAIDDQLTAFLEANPALKATSGAALPGLNAVYAEMIATAPRDLWMTQLLRNSVAFDLASRLEAIRLRAKGRVDSSYLRSLSQELKSYQEAVRGAFGLYHPELEKDFLKMMLSDVDRVFASDKLKGDRPMTLPASYSDQWLMGLLASSKLLDSTFLLAQNVEGISNLLDNDPFLKFARPFLELRDKIAAEGKSRAGKIAELMPAYLDARMAMQQSNFIPDANATLRLTYGHVRGYSPEDAVYQMPVTTLKGVLEKGAGGDEEFSYPAKLKQLHDAKDFGKYVHPTLGDVPVAILYNLDTSGGNSGSPVMNAKGELIAINFDRAFTATINDFAWNEAYSRSIGCDIRYVLFVIDKYSGAKELLAELGQ